MTSEILSSLWGVDPDSCSPFVSWLVRQSSRDDPVGDLARDVIQDRDFRYSLGSTGAEVRSYFEDYLGCDKFVVQAAQRAWYEFSGRSRARNISPATRFEIFKRDGYRCRLCGATAGEDRLEVDHKVPVALGGTGQPDNLWILCFTCNRGKSDQLLEDVVEPFNPESNTYQIS